MWVWYPTRVVRRVAAIVVIGGLLAGSASSFLSPSASGSPSAARGGVRLAVSSGRLIRGRWQAWANAALVPTVRGRVTLRLTGCPSLPRAAGCVYASAPRVIHLRRDARDPHAVLLHELGHVYDLTVLSDRDRDAVRSILGLPAGRRWWAGATAPAEWFAEGYSWCARLARISSIGKSALYGYDPTPAQHRRLCALIRRAARDRTPPTPPPAPPVVTDVSPAVAPRAAAPESPARTPVPAVPRAMPAPTMTPTPSPTRQGKAKPVPTTPPITPHPKITPTPTATLEPSPEPTAQPEPDPEPEPTPAD